MSAAESIRRRARDLVADYQGNANDAPLLVQAIENALRQMMRDERAACVADADSVIKLYGGNAGAAAVKAAIMARGAT